MDAGRTEVEIAAKAGAQIVDVLGTATDATIAECVQARQKLRRQDRRGPHCRGRSCGAGRPGGGPGGALYRGARGHRRADARPGPLRHSRRRQPGSQGAGGRGRRGQLRDRGSGRGPRRGLRHRRRRHHQAKDPAVATQEIRRALDEGAVIPTTLFKRWARPTSAACSRWSPAPTFPTPCTAAGCWKVSGPCSPAPAW